MATSMKMMLIPAMVLYKTLIMILKVINAILQSKIGKFLVKVEKKKMSIVGDIGAKLFGGNAPAVESQANNDNRNQQVTNNNQQVTVNTQRDVSPNNGDVFGMAIANQMNRL